MCYIVLDLEYNQAYDFQDGSSFEPEEDCPFEIIQIGAVKLNNQYEYEGSFSVFIKPRIYERLHPYVEKITGITAADLEEGVSFPEAVESFLQFIGNEKFVICVWGANDVKELWKNMVYYNIKYDYKKLKYINLQMIASKFLKHEKGMSIGLKNAIINFDIHIDRPFHNALNDAYYTSKIFQILQKQNLSVQNFNFAKSNKNVKTKVGIINFSKMYTLIEKELGRKLNAKEKKIYRNVYIMGKNNQFDILKNKSD